MSDTEYEISSDNIESVASILLAAGPFEVEASAITALMNDRDSLWSALDFLLNKTSANDLNKMGYEFSDEPDPDDFAASVNLTEV